MSEFKEVLQHMEDLAEVTSGYYEPFLRDFLFHVKIMKQNHDVDMRTRMEIISERNALIANVIGHGNQDGYDSCWQACNGRCDCESCEMLRKKLTELRSGDGWLTWRGGRFAPVSVT